MALSAELFDGLRLFVMSFEAQFGEQLGWDAADEFGKCLFDTVANEFLQHLPDFRLLEGFGRA